MQRRRREADSRGMRSRSPMAARRTLFFIRSGVSRSIAVTMRVHRGIYFLLRPVPVFGGEGVECEVVYAERLLRLFGGQWKRPRHGLPSARVRAMWLPRRCRPLLLWRHAAEVVRALSISLLASAKASFVCRIRKTDGVPVGMYLVQVRRSRSFVMAKFHAESHG